MAESTTLLLLLLPLLLRYFMREQLTADVVDHCVCGMQCRIQLLLQQQPQCSILLG
jgi:hypothetical protein